MLLMNEECEMVAVITPYTGWMESAQANVRAMNEVGRITLETLREIGQQQQSLLRDAMGSWRRSADASTGEDKAALPQAPFDLMRSQAELASRNLAELTEIVRKAQEEVMKAVIRRADEAQQEAVEAGHQAIEAAGEAAANAEDAAREIGDAGSR
jgi:hypothetical protein